MNAFKWCSLLLFIPCAGFAQDSPARATQIYKTPPVYNVAHGYRVPRWLHGFHFLSPSFKRMQASPGASTASFGASKCCHWISKDEAAGSPAEVTPPGPPRPVSWSFLSLRFK